MSDISKVEREAAENKIQKRRKVQRGRGGSAPKIKKSPIQDGDYFEMRGGLNFHIFPGGLIVPVENVRVLGNTY